MSFSLDVSKFADDAIEATEDTIKNTAIALFSAIIKDTPVDTGRARGNWFASNKQPSIQVTDARSKSGAGPINAMTKKILGYHDVSIVQLTNNLPYIKVLEDGGYPDPVKYGTRINESGNKNDRSTWVTPIYEKRSKSGYSKKAPSGMVKVNIARFNRLLTLEARKRKL